jgi:DNA-binding MarR family transcriptional regulator
MADKGFADPSEQGYWRPLTQLQRSMDAEISRIYAEARIEGLKPNWVMELLRLHARGPMTLTELAESVQLTHSAISQKVAAMRAAGWVKTVAGPDGRSKQVVLTPRTRAVIGQLAAEWRATEAAAAEIDAELSFPLNRFVAEMEAALGRASFHDRILRHLAQDPDWKPAQ